MGPELLQNAGVGALPPQHQGPNMGLGSELSELETGTKLAQPSMGTPRIATNGVFPTSRLALARRASVAVVSAGCLLAIGSAFYPSLREGSEFVLESLPKNKEGCPNVKKMTAPTGFVLNFTMIFMRHSIRGPQRSSRWTDMRKFPYGHGALTDKGIRAAKRVGCMLRRYYGRFLPRDLAKVATRVSSITRCVDTLGHVLQSMIPRENLERNATMKKFKITDAFVLSGYSNFYNLTDPVLTKHNFKTFGELQAWLQRKSKFRSYADVHNRVVDAFVSHKYNGIKLPSWAVDYYDAIFYSFKVVLATGKQKGIDGAKILRWFLNRIERSTTSDKYKLYVMNYHDTTLLLVLNLIDVDTVKYFPRFAAGIHFQVFNPIAESGEPVVRILYFQGLAENSTYIDPMELKLPDCGTLCPMKQFSRSVNTLFDNYYKKAAAEVSICVDRLTRR